MQIILKYSKILKVKNLKRYRNLLFSLLLLLLFFLMKELASALVDRDRAICEKNELLEKFCHEVKDKAEAQKELNQACKDIETVREERDVARKERTEAIIQRDQLLQEYYQARQVARRTDDLSSQMEGLVYFSDSNPFIPSHIVVVFYFILFFLQSAGWFLHIDFC